MGLTGWKELKANAFLDLANAMEGDQNLQNVIEQFGERIADQHQSMVWLSSVSQSLFGT